MTTQLAERLERLVVRGYGGFGPGGSECWLWEGARSASGYGQLRFRGVTLYAHRVAYEAFVAPIPSGLQVDHLCRNRACCNPAHLEPVTCQENLLRGDTVTARRAAVTHCPRGHEYTVENTIVSSRGQRNCWICKRYKDRRYRAANRERCNARDRRRRRTICGRRWGGGA